ncbi:MAG: hypothetical protein EZS28_028923, partial [Streblomastix strix]
TMQRDKLLRDNIETQLLRLTNQLKDLEESREDLGNDEYEEMKQETISQLREFQASLENMMQGNLTVVDELGHIRLAIQAAISAAFKTPEVISLFAKKQPQQLRQRLEQHKRDFQLQKISEDVFHARAVEILVALKHLGDTLTPQESEILERYGKDSLAQFSLASNAVGEKNLFSATKSQILSAQKK